MSGLNNNTEVAKTVKLYIGGKFPRTESGRTFAINYANSEKVYAHICQSSRKDLRNTVVIANKAQPAWQALTAYNRSQILYRMAEMLQARKEEVATTITSTMNIKDKEANTQVDGAIDALIYYAGFADKYQALLGTINPVAGPHHNFTTVEPVGTVALLYDKKEVFQLNDWMAHLAAIICSGNTTIALLPEEASALLAPIAEIFATSDLPGGVVNLLTGHFDELFPHFSTHMELQSVSFQKGNNEELKQLQIAASETMKRVILPTDNPCTLEHLLSFTEYKTVWHPNGF